MNKIQTFKVKKNKNFFKGPKFNFLSIRKNKFHISAYFWDNCIYTLNDNKEQINKLFGYSFNLLPFFKSGKIMPGHHKNSIRFGWRSVNEQIEILAYVYINGICIERSIIFVNTESLINLYFENNENSYSFKIVDDEGNSSIGKIMKPIKKKSFINLFMYKLYPYFGGKISAPHNMRIDLRFLK